MKRIIIYSLVVILAVIAAVYVDRYITAQKIEATTNSIKEKIKYVDTTKEKIEKLKWDIVEEIAACETGGLDEGYKNAVVVMDSNGYFSRGRWQFQLKTIQHYYKKFYQKDITLDEAALIAHTEDKARNLAYRIVWDEVGGVYNWANCERKLGLRSKIEVIRKLDE